MVSVFWTNFVLLSENIPDNIGIIKCTFPQEIIEVVLYTSLAEKKIQRDSRLWR